MVIVVKSTHLFLGKKIKYILITGINQKRGLVTIRSVLLIH